MAHDIDITATQRVRRMVEEELTVNRVQVDSVHFDFTNKIATALVMYGNLEDEKFTILHQECWVLDGPFYLGKFTEFTETDEMIADALLRMVTSVVSEVLSTPGRKDELIASGELFLGDAGAMTHFQQLNQRAVRRRSTPPQE